ncbi:MAG: hypothetical protein JWM18_3545 [Chloroflexi bacterium]|nr:hypothetical protein [Chloroflexota bacterium]
MHTAHAAGTGRLNGAGIPVRVVSWNLQYRVGAAAAREAADLRALDPQPDLLLLQEVNRSVVEDLCGVVVG